MVPDVQRSTTVQDEQRVSAGSPQQAGLPTPSGQRWNWFLRSLGIAVACVGGGSVWVLLGMTGGVTLPLFALMILCGFLGALLLRSWWALLFMPLAFIMGIFVVSAYQAHGLAVQKWFDFRGVDPDIWFLFPVFFGVPLAAGAALGTFIGERVEKWLRR